MRPIPSFTILRVALVLLAPLAASCEGASVNVKTAPGFTPGPATVSVLGVFRDGRMSTDAWTPLGPPLSTTLGQVGDLCEVAYGERLQQEAPDVFTFIEEDTRMNGITEDMLLKLAPKAQGELILTVTIHGKIVQAAASPDRDDMAPASQPAIRPGAARGRPGARPSPTRGVAPGGLQMTGSLFSVSKQKSVARVNLAYTGTSVEEAFRRFAAEVATVVPGGTCKGWKWRDAAPLPGVPGVPGVPGAGLP